MDTHVTRDSTVSGEARPGNVVLPQWHRMGSSSSHAGSGSSRVVDSATGNLDVSGQPSPSMHFCMHLNSMTMSGRKLIIHIHANYGDTVHDYAPVNVC